MAPAWAARARSIRARSSASRITVPPFALATACSGVRAPTRAWVQPRCATVQAMASWARSIPCFSRTGANSARSAATRARFSAAKRGFRPRWSPGAKVRSGPTPAGQQALSQGRVGQEGRVVAGAPVQVRSRLAPVQHAELLLVGIEGADGRIPGHLLRHRVAGADRADLAFVLQAQEFGHGVLDGGGRLLPVGLVEVDGCPCAGGAGSPPPPGGWSPGRAGGTPGVPRPCAGARRRCRRHAPPGPLHARPGRIWSPVPPGRAGRRWPCPRLSRRRRSRRQGQCRRDSPPRRWLHGCCGWRPPRPCRPTSSRRWPRHRNRRPKPGCPTGQENDAACCGIPCAWFACPVSSPCVQV